MPKFRKKPVVIEAFQMTPERRKSNCEWLSWMHEAWHIPRGEIGSLQPMIEGTGEGPLEIVTLEGTMLVNWHDWIIRGIKGELYPCKPQIFNETYERVENADV